MKSSNSELLPVPESVRIDDAITWTSNWRSADHHLKACSFTFEADDFRAILTEQNVSFIRLYLAIQVQGSATGNTLVEKLLCVGVDADGKDIIPSKTTDSTGIYDFSRPCPPICSLDNSSPLHC